MIPSLASASITGRRHRCRQRHGSPITSASIAPVSMCISRSCDILLHIEDAQRRTALAGALEGRDHDVAHRLFRQGGAVDDHRVQAAGLGDQHGVGPGIRGQRPVDDLRRLGRAGEADAGDARIAGQRRRRPSPSPGSSCSAASGSPPARISSTARRGDQRGLLGRFGQHRIAGGQRRRDLTGEDRQREVPRADADEDAAAAARSASASSRSASLA